MEYGQHIVTHSRTVSKRQDPNNTLYNQTQTCYLYSHKAASYYSYFNHVYFKNKQKISKEQPSNMYM